MNDEQRVPEEPSEEPISATDAKPQPGTDEAVAEALATDDIDVESALAAVASLHQLAIEEVPDEEAESDAEEAGQITAEEDGELDSAEETEDFANEPERDELEEEGIEIAVFDRVDRRESLSTSVVSSSFDRPPVSTLHRGQAASIIPALLLMGSGAALTLLLTTQDVALDAALIGSLAVAGLGVAFLSYWLSTSRWSQGSFFAGMVLLLGGATLAYLIWPNNLSLEQGWPLVVIALGTAFVAADVANPSPRPLWLIGVVIAVAGFAGIAVTSNLLNDTVTDSLVRLWPAALILVAVLLIAPLFRQSGS